MINFVSGIMATLLSVMAWELVDKFKDDFAPGMYANIGVLVLMFCSSILTYVVITQNRR